jgi:GT2 family glycosyltransferase
MIAKAPIAILAFNRPDYLDQTLRSLAEQAEESLAGREIHLFQDGMFNEFSGRTYGVEEVALNNLALFGRLFPSGHIHRQERNLGIALHFDFIERYLFESRSFEAAIFLEDDLMLSSLYLMVIDRMLAEAMSNESIGCVAAYGNRRATLAEQMLNPSKIVSM